jgi:hypothetical protein
MFIEGLSLLVNLYNGTNGTNFIAWALSTKRKIYQICILELNLKI